MKNILSILILLLLTNFSYADTLDEVRVAYNNYDYLKAIGLLKIESAKNNPEAQYYLGRMYANGQGEKRDDEAAVYWFEKSAVQGFDKAQYSLGHMYAYSDILKPDNEQAMIWFKKAAMQGHSDAVYEVNLLTSN